MENDGFEDIVGGNADDPPRLIVGDRLKFSNEAKHVLPGGQEFPDDEELAVIDVARAVQKWVNRLPVETKVLGPGEGWPDIEALNAQADKSEWREGPDGKMHGPWQGQTFVRMVHLQSMHRYTFVTGTVGGAIAVRDLAEATELTRRFRGQRVYPVVKLSSVFMPTRFGGRQRPDFVIVDWVSFGGGEGALPAPEMPRLSGPKSVPPATLSEVVEDEIPF